MGNLAKVIADTIIGVKTNKIDITELHDYLDKNINNIKVKVWREDKNIPLPKYGKDGDACCDVYVKSVKYDLEKDNYIIHTGLHFELPSDYEMELRPRSSNTKTDYYMPNPPGTLDEGYRGELLVIFKNRTNINLIRCIDEQLSAINGLGNNTVQKDNVEKFKLESRKYLDDVYKEFPYAIGDRCCQLLIRRREKIEWEEVESLEDLSNSSRASGGFGSTGK